MKPVIGGFSNLWVHQGCALGRTCSMVSVLVVCCYAGKLSCHFNDAGVQVRIDYSDSVCVCRTCDLCQNFTTLCSAIILDFAYQTKF